MVVNSVSDRDTLTELMRGTDVVYHLAAAQHEANVPHEHFRAVNVEGTRNVFEARDIRKKKLHFRGVR